MIPIAHATKDRSNPITTNAVSYQLRPIAAAHGARNSSNPTVPALATRDQSNPKATIVVRDGSNPKTNTTVRNQSNHTAATHNARDPLNSTGNNAARD